MARPMQIIRERALAGIAFSIGLGAGLALLYGFGFLDIWGADVFGGDYSAIWAGPHLLVTGRDPYDSATWLALNEELGVQPPGAVVYLYPGWVAVLLAPFGLLDLEVSALVWIALGVIVGSVGLFVLLGARARRHPLVHTILAFTLLGSESGIVAFYSGQIDFLIIGGLALMVAWLRTERLVPAGIAAGVLLIKPQLFVVAIPALARLALARGEQRFLWSFVATGAALAIVSTLVVPQWWGAWLTLVPTARAGDLRGATLLNGMRDIFGPAGIALGLVMLAATLVAAFRFSPRSRAALPVWLSVSMSMAPYMFVYDHVVGIVPLAVAAGINGERRARSAIIVASYGVLILVLAGTLLHAVPGVAYGTLSFNGLAQFALTVTIIVSLWRFRSTTD